MILVVFKFTTCFLRVSKQTDNSTTATKDMLPLSSAFPIKEREQQKRLVFKHSTHLKNLTNVTKC